MTADAEHWMAPRIRELDAWLDAHPEVALRPRLSWRDLPPTAPLFVTYTVFSTRAQHESAASDCLIAANKCLEILARGHKTFVRVPPEVSDEVDFATRERRVCGYTRFKVCPEEGAWTFTSAEPQINYGSYGQ